MRSAVQLKLELEFEHLETKKVNGELSPEDKSRKTVLKRKLRQIKSQQSSR